MGLKRHHFLFQWCKRLKATRIFNKNCEEKNSLWNICSEIYGQRWFQMLSALFSVYIFSQSFHEEECHYLFWFKKLSNECILFLFTVQSKQWVHLFCCNQSYKSAQTWERAILSAVYRQTLFCILSLQELPKRGEFHHASKKSHKSEVSPVEIMK